MGTPEDGFDRLLLAAASAPLDETPWRALVATFREVLGGNYADVVFRRPGEERDAIEVHDGVDVPDWLHSRYQRLAGDNPIRYFAMEPGRVYAYEELEGVSREAPDRFREQFLEPAGFHRMLMFRVAEPNGCSLWMAVTRPASAAEFTAQDRERCARLARHLVPILSCHVALLNRAADAAAYRRAAEMLAFGVISLGESREVITADAAAMDHLSACGHLRIKGRKLWAGGDQELLHGRIDEALRRKETRLVHLGDVDGLDLLLVPVSPRADAAPGGPALLVYLSARRRWARDLSEHLATLFGISQTQARLAALLAGGYTLSQAAAEIGLTEQSARTYSKEIYARTGTRRQGELIQRILTSVAMLS